MTSSDFDIPESGAVFAFGKDVPSKFHIKNDSIVSAACGEGHALICVESGRVFGFGSNDYGQLGLGHSRSTDRPVCVKSLKEAKVKIVKVACGPTHSLLLAEDGRIYGCGSNSDGQLLMEDEEPILAPQELRGLKRLGVKQLAAGRHFSLALTAKGDLFAWGSNAEGCLGQNDEDLEGSNEPLKVALPGKVSSISAGSYHCASVLSNGQLFAWGESDSGKLGAREAARQEFCRRPVPVPLPSGARAVAVACGGQHTLVLTDSGCVLAAGRGEMGQLGMGPKVQQSDAFRQVTALDKMAVSCIAAGSDHSICCSQRTGKAFTFGSNRHGQLGPKQQQQQQQPQPLRSLQPVRIETVACGSVLTVLLATPRARGDTGSASDGDEEEEENQGRRGVGKRRFNPLKEEEEEEDDEVFGGSGGAGSLKGKRQSRAGSVGRAGAASARRNSLGVGGGGSGGGVAASGFVSPRRFANHHGGNGRDLPPLSRTPKRLEPLASREVNDLSRKQHVMASTKFDSMLSANSQLSPDSNSDSDTGTSKRKNSKQKNSSSSSRRSKSPPLNRSGRFSSRNGKLASSPNSKNPASRSDDDDADSDAGSDAGAGGRRRKQQRGRYSRGSDVDGSDVGSDASLGRQREEKEMEEGRDFEGNGGAVSGVGCGRRKRQEKAGAGEGGGKSRSCAVL